MLSPELITELKKNNKEIFSVDLEGEDHVFRSLTFDEYDELMAHKEWNTADFEDGIVTTALVYPEEIDLDNLQAGTVTSLAEEILEYSCFILPVKEIRAILQEKRDQSNTIRNLMKAFILATQPAYTDEQLDKYTFRQLLDKIALAEQIIGLNQATMGFDSSAEIRFDVIDPEEEAEKLQAQANKQNVIRKPGTATVQDPIAARLAQAMGG